MKPKIPGYCMRCRFFRKTQLLWESQSRHKSWHGCTFCIQSTFDLLWVSIPWLPRKGNPSARQDQILFHACCRVNCERSWTKENYYFDTYASFCWAQHPILMFLWLTKAHPPIRGGQNFWFLTDFKYVHKRQTGKQVSPVSIQLFLLLICWSYTEHQRLRAKRLKKTSDFV